ncbi:MAG: restriction endonuclease subunit S [Parcubacteria group bacterium]|jgi:type I restriction enzyme S subunit
MIKCNQKFKETEIGAIPEEWDAFDIQSVADVIGGGTPSTSNENNFNGAIPWITPRDLSSYQDRFISRGERCISEEGLNSSNAKLLPVNTVLLTTRAPVGYLAIAKNEVSTNQGFHSLIPNSKTDSFFLFYLLKNNVQKLIDHASGSTFQELNGKTLKSLEFAFPKIDEQKRIAEILSSLDDKIELNRKINANLEKIASSLFKKLFVDIGDELPEGWRIGTFGEATENFDSKRVPMSSREREKKHGAYPYYGATSIMDYVDDYIFDGTYVLLGEDGSVARENGSPFVQYVSGKIWVNNHAHVLQGKNGFSTEHVKVFLDQLDIMPFVTGAVQPKLNQANMNSIPMAVPDQKTLGKFNEVLEVIFGMILDNEKRNRNMEQIRDSLLPRLMSGKIRVR